MKPKGYYVLVKMEKVEIKELAQGSSIILAAPKSKEEKEREQSGHPVGVIDSFGPLAYVGHQGCDADTAEGRAAQWGVKVGDKIEFNRHDGKVPNHPDYQDYRILLDSHVVAGI